MTYCKGNVYKIICSVDNNICYIGSTFNQVRHRFQSHKNSYECWLKNNKKATKLSLYPYFEKYGIENFKWVLIKSYKVYREHKHDFKHLHSKEQLWISKTKCINIKNSFSIPYIYKKFKHIFYIKSDKEWYNKNRGKILIREKEYRKKNKENIKKRLQNYYKDNLEKIENKNKIPYTCIVCNKTMRKDSKWGHNKSKTHIKNLEKSQQ